MAAAAPPDVLIVSYRRADLLQRALQSVVAHLPGSRILVWDNWSPASEEIRELARSWPTLDWTFSSDNHGFAYAVNRLMERVQGSSALLLNPDAVLLGSLQGCRQALAKDATVAAAAPWVDEGRYRPWDNAHREPTALRQLVSFAGWDDRLARRPALSMLYARQPHEVGGYLTGACLLLSVPAWRTIGPFDEAFFLYAEEADWCRRGRQLGYRLIAVPELGVRHSAAGTVSDSRDGSSRSAALLLESQLRYQRKHHGSVSASAYRFGTRLIDRVQPAKRRARRENTNRGGALAFDVILTTPTLGFGGAERQRVTVANGLSAGGLRVSVCALQALGPVTAEVAESVAVRQTNFHRPVREAGPSTLLVTGTTRVEIVYGALWRQINRPNGHWVVAHHHPAADDRSIFGPAHSWLMRRADGAIYLSPGHRRDHARHRAVDRGRYWIVPNGIPIEELPSPNADQPTSSPVRLVTIGRLVEHKQVHLLIEALNEGLNDLDWTLDVWGDGPEMVRLRSLAASSPHAERIRLRGWCSDVSAALANADIFCMPSRFEAQPLVVLEALAARVAVIAAPVAAVPEILAGGCGLLVDPPTVQMWRTALRRLITGEDERRALATAGHDRVMRDYTAGTMAARYRAIYEEMAGRRPATNVWP